MSIKKFIQDVNEKYGEVRYDHSNYTDSPPCRIPDWVRGLIEDAYKEGVKDGKKTEKRRLKARFNKKITFGGMNPWREHKISEMIFG